MTRLCRGANLDKRTNLEMILDLKTSRRMGFKDLQLKPYSA